MARPGTARTAGRPRGGTDDTRQALVDAAVVALREDGFAGASARSIARRAGCNQSLVFYHFGTVVDLLLAALDQVSAVRMARYRDAVASAGDLPGLVAAARTVFQEDLDAGHVAVLAEMVAGASSTPGLGAEIAVRLAPWRDFAADAVRRAVAGGPVASLLPADEASHAVVALYLGLEMLAHLDGDRSAALALFDRAAAVAPLVAMVAGTGPTKSTTRPTGRATARAGGAGA